MAKSPFLNDSSCELEEMRLDITWSDDDSDDGNCSPFIGNKCDIVLLQTPAEKKKYGVCGAQSLAQRKRSLISDKEKQADIIDDPSPGSVATPLNISSIKKKVERVLKSQESVS